MGHPREWSPRTTLWFSTDFSSKISHQKGTKNAENLPSSLVKRWKKPLKTNPSGKPGLGAVGRLMKVFGVPVLVLQAWAEPAGACAAGGIDGLECSPGKKLVRQ